VSAVSYPRLIKRVRAVLIDSVVVPIAAVVSLMVGYAAGITELWARVVLVAVPILIMEPGLVAWTGGTIGHHLVGVKVLKADGIHRLNFFAATLRAIVKFILGWFSLIFVLTTARHQAIHDLVVNSIVVHSDVSGLPSYEVLPERQVESNQYTYPAKWRRVLFIVMYWALCTIALIVFLALLSSENCSRFNRCTTSEVLASIVIQVVWLLTTGGLIVLGWSGRLPGAKRSAKMST
jgi:uncharacterized RDD family membrane protein YckC